MVLWFVRRRRLKAPQLLLPRVLARANERVRALGTEGGRGYRTRRILARACSRRSSESFHSISTSSFSANSACERTAALAFHWRVLRLPWSILFRCRRGRVFGRRPAGSFPERTRLLVGAAAQVSPGLQVPAVSRPGRERREKVGGSPPPCRLVEIAGTATRAVHRRRRHYRSQQHGRAVCIRLCPSRRHLRPVISRHHECHRRLA
jgi:hypothetical protein